MSNDVVDNVSNPIARNIDQDIDRHSIPLKSELWSVEIFHRFTNLIRIQ